MVNHNYQHQCSSMALSYNLSLLARMKASYIIIDVGPIPEQKTNPPVPMGKTLMETFDSSFSIMLTATIQRNSLVAFFHPPLPLLFFIAADALSMTNTRVLVDLSCFLVSPLQHQNNSDVELSKFYPILNMTLILYR